MKAIAIAGLIAMIFLGACTRGDESSIATRFENVTEIVFKNSLRDKDIVFSVTDKQAIAEFINTIKLEPKDPCKCGHSESVTFKKDGSEIFAHFCSHCFVVRDAGKDHEYKMPKDFYDLYKRLLEKHMGEKRDDGR